MSTTVQSQTTIGASTARVWAGLTDFDSYPAWNPFVRAISGDLQRGSRLAVRIAPSGGAGMAFKPVVTELREEAVLEWLGHLIVPGIFDWSTPFRVTTLERRNDILHAERDLQRPPDPPREHAQHVFV